MTKDYRKPFYITIIVLALIILIGGIIRSREESAQRLYDFRHKSSSQSQTSIEIFATGRITTFVDGENVERVNLWSTTDDNRTMVNYLSNREKVNLLDIDGEYYYLQSQEDTFKKGWCNMGFVIKDR